MPRLLLVLLLLLAYSPAFAQSKTGQAYLDSLLAELPRAKPDTNRVKLLNMISNQSANLNPNEGINYANQSLVLARRLTWKKGMAYAYVILGKNYTAKIEFPKALASQLSGLKIAEEIKDKNLIAGLTGNVGRVYAILANYPQALAYYEKALKGHEELGDKISVVIWLANIGNVYSQQGEYAQALAYQLKALKLNEAIGYHKESSFNDVGLAYLNLANYPQALTYLQNALNFSKADGGKLTLVGIYNNLGKLYLKIATDSNSTALTTLLSSNKINTLRKAKSYADSARVIVDKFVALKEPYYELHKTQSEIQDALGEPKAALASFKQYITAKDSVINHQNSNNVGAATLQYEFDKKETALKFEQQLTTVQLQQQKQQRTYLLGGVGLLLALLGLIVYGYAQKQKANTVLQRQKEEINHKSSQLEQSLAELKATQTQLIQQEKMASLGELTAGIAHEIQNPLNFVNNFSEVSAELVIELKEEREKSQPGFSGERDSGLEDELLDDLQQNLQKIAHHGGRASAIIKAMLEHSRSATGEKQPTNLNALADEYLKIAYHGLRAKDKDFNAELNTDFGTDLGLIELAPQEIGRVLLNLYNNAFYAVNEKHKTASLDYKPMVTVSTTRLNGHVEIRVSDNGTGIPDSVKAKIFQPFFTTKPTGEGTGLGLSLSYDIITKGQGGSLTVESQEGEGTAFVIQLSALS